MKAITYYCDTPAIQAMCGVYGRRWEAINLGDRTAIIIALSIATNHVCVTGHSQRLDLLAQENWQFDDPSLSNWLADLDGELESVQDALYLIAGIAQTTPPPVLEQAA